MIRPEAPDSELLQRCDLGPLPPDGDQPLAVVAPVVKSRDKAARVCVDRHAGLAAYVERITGTQPDQAPKKPVP